MPECAKADLQQSRILNFFPVKDLWKGVREGKEAGGRVSGKGKENGLEREREGEKGKGR